MQYNNVNDRIPPGFRLCHTLQGHEGEIKQIAWSTGGQILASGSDDGAIRLWDVKTGQTIRVLRGFYGEHDDHVNTIAWSPGGQILASGSDDGTIRLWDVKTGQAIQNLSGHKGHVNTIAWSPGGQILASGSDDGTIWLWDVKTGQEVQILGGHTGHIKTIAWSPDGRELVSGSDDQTIQLWNVKTGQILFTQRSDLVYSVTWSLDGRMLAWGTHDHIIRIWDPRTRKRSSLELEGHTNAVTCVSFSADGHLLASASRDETVRLWRTDTWETIVILNESLPDEQHFPWKGTLAFHPKEAVLSTLGVRGTVLHIWDLELATLFGIPAIPSIHYTNAKVVLVGDSGVGKSGLGLVLTGHPFVPTESTHGRHIWPFAAQEETVASGQRERREILLWDLAGQFGYRLIHQLHLNEVSVALIIFNAQSETDPFAGVYHWVRALRLAQRLQKDSALTIKKFLVAARLDRGGRGVSQDRLLSLMTELDIDDYFETSAKTGRNIAELTEAIRKAVDWEELPKVSSTQLFQRIKAFLIAEKESGRLLPILDELYLAFLASKGTTAEIQKLYVQFKACIGRMESRGLIRRLSFGNRVLLQPELLDAYASALINAIEDEPDGLGSISEERARAGNFNIPEDERIIDKEEEKLLLIAMVEDLLHHEIALRESADDGQYLIFPSQSTRENPDLPDPEGKSVIFRFDGPVLSIYATLAVRLSHSGFFIKKDLWKNAIIYSTKSGGTYGLFLRNSGEGHAELTLFFKEAREETRIQFEEYVKTHLKRRALPETFQQQDIFACPNCGTLFTDQQVEFRRKNKHNWIMCVCDNRVQLPESAITQDKQFIESMDRTADIRRDRAIAAFMLQSKVEIDDYDVFLCYNRVDNNAVKVIGEQLKTYGLLPWFDEWDLQPGKPWQRLLEDQVAKVKSAAVFIGKKGIGPWQRQEIDAFLRELVERGCPVIPVILEDATNVPVLPLFLRGITWVDFRWSDPDPIEQLIWGITGKRATY